MSKANNGSGRSDSENDAGVGPKNRHPFEQKRPGGPQWPHGEGSSADDNEDDE